MTPAGADEGEEIDRIMKEIEDLEKKMDTSPTDAGEVETGKQNNPVAASEPNPETEQEEQPEEQEHFTSRPSSKVVPMRPSVVESLAETDAVPARDEPLMHPSDTHGDGGLSLKIGGCADVNLEFTRSGMSVSLSCSDEGLTIRTDQGAEFRIPFKRTA
ncbi:MAG: hypothetical protein HY074_12875 [Deltaproteobacteria bacterium]|nr:hypothetical protein [Deltaproteobacteria bacterium]